MSNASIDDVAAEVTTVIPDVVGWYAFALQVTDDLGAVANDSMVIEVLYPPTNNDPISDAGPDLSFSASVTCTLDSYGNYSCPSCAALNVGLTGAGSSDPDGDLLYYAWTLLSGTATLGSPTAEGTSMTTSTVPATYGLTNTLTWEVQLLVSDCTGADDVDSVIVSYDCEGV